MAKKKTAENVLNLENILFNCRDILRVARNSGSFFEKRDMMLTLVFLRFIGEKYKDGVAKLRDALVEQGLDPDDENIFAIADLPFCKMNRPYVAENLHHYPYTLYY